MKNNHRIAFVTALGALSALSSLSCATAFAQSDEPAYNPSWYITPSVNVLRPDSKFGVDKNGEGLGLRWGKAFSPSWDFQFGPTYARSKNNGLKYEQTTLGADWLYMFSRERFRPFLLLGIGAERDKLSGGGIDTSKTSPYVNGGLGFQYSFTDQWSTQVDVRRVHGYLRNNSDFGFDRSRRRCQMRSFFVELGHGQEARRHAEMGHCGMNR